MDEGDTLSVDLDRELKIRWPQLHDQMRHEAMENSINQINETRRAELAAWTPYPGQLAQQRAQSQKALMAHICSQNPILGTEG